MLTTRTLQPEEFESIGSFYGKNQYRAAIEPCDLFIVAEESGAIRAAVRLCHQEGILLLRGMRVAPAFQRRGIGSHLLRFVESTIADEVCYCIPHTYLRSFYGRIGFGEIASDEAPRFLRERCEQYESENGLDVIIMRRPSLIDDAAR